MLPSYFMNRFHKIEISQPIKNFDLRKTSVKEIRVAFSVLKKVLEKL